MGSIIRTLILKGRKGLHARIDLIEPDQANAEVKEIYEQRLKGKPGNVQKPLAHRPEMLKNFLALYASVGRRLITSSTN
jgi:hypothetical protein